MIAEMDLLEQRFIIFPDGLPTVNRSCVIHQNRVLREGRGHGACSAVVECLVIFLVERGKLLDYLCIDRVFFYGRRQAQQS
jgi:hypothetical protein